MASFCKKTKYAGIVKNIVTGTIRFSQFNKVLWGSPLKEEVLMNGIWGVKSSSDQHSKILLVNAVNQPRKNKKPCYSTISTPTCHLKTLLRILHFRYSLLVCTIKQLLKERIKKVTNIIKPSKSPFQLKKFAYSTNLT